jgi:potassium efflux system protein
MLRLLLAACLWLGALVPGAFAQEPSPAAPVQDVDAATAAIQERIDRIKADDSLAAELKAALLDTYGKALEDAKKADAAAAEAQRLEGLRAAAPDNLAEARRQLVELDQRPHGPPERVTAEDLQQRRAAANLAQLEQGLAKAQQEQAADARATVELDKEVTRRSERRALLPAASAELKKRLEALPAQIPDAPELDARQTSARRALRVAERRRLQGEIDAAAAELLAYEAEEELLRARRDLAARQATWDKANVEAWQGQVQIVRDFEAQRAAAEAAAQAQAARTADPQIARFAGENEQLARQLANLSSVLLPRAEREKAETDADLERLTREFEAVKKRVAAVGATDEVGVLLRERRARLSEMTSSSTARSRERRARLAHALLNHFNFDERRLRLVADPESWPEDEFGTGNQWAQSTGDAAAEARQLRDARLATLARLGESYNLLWKTLNDVDTTETQLFAIVDAYREYVAEHVLGIRSSQPIWNLAPAPTFAELVWFANAAEYVRVGRLLVDRVQQQIWPLAVLLPILTLLLLRTSFRRGIAEAGKDALRGTNTSYAPTARALVYTVLLTAPLPALLWFSGKSLAGHPDCTEFGKAMASGADHSMPFLALVLALRASVRPNGLGEAHFRWQPVTLKLLRRNLSLMLPAAFPLSFLLGALEARSSELAAGRLGTLVLITEMVLLLIVAWRMLHPGGGITARPVTARNAAHRFRWLWFGLGFGTPLVLLVMAALGYDYTAMQLARRLLYTVAVVAAGVFVHALIVRSLVLVRRRLQIKQAQERLQAAKAAGDTAAAEPAAVEEIDPGSLARQTQTLLRLVLTILVVLATYRIWVDVLPALAVLQRIVLWTDASSTPPEAIKLSDLLLSLIVLALSLAAGRNVPAMLELLVLQRLPMQSGERHAITTLARYGIVIVGFVLAFSTIGIGWSKVQWLVAAVSVGLGFGLQEIFANFVSGLILLFERPARVGDIVSVGEVTGRVTRIRIRATTIQDWDRKELVVPNREFVTTRFVNWTLSDSIVRWTIPVGVAYGSDTKKALELLLQAARESRWALGEPKPEATFVRFGDSSLDLQLRVYLDMGSVEVGWITELHQAIDRLFREHGIVIAFPQRDVHLSVTGPLLERLQPDDLPAARDR